MSRQALVHAAQRQRRGGDQGAHLCQREEMPCARGGEKRQVVFRGRFCPTSPQDVGGGGWLCSTPLSLSLPSRALLGTPMGVSYGLPRRRRRLGGRGSSTRHPLLGSRAIRLEVGSGLPKTAPAGRRGYSVGAAAGASTVVGRVGRGDAAHQLAQPLHVPLPKRKSQAQPLGGGHAAQGGPPVGDPGRRRRWSRAGSPGSSAGAGRNPAPV